MELFSKIVSWIGLALYGVKTAEEMISGRKQGQVKKEMATRLIQGGLDLAVEQGELSAEDADKGKRIGDKAIDLAHSVLSEFNLLKGHEGAEAEGG